MKFKCYNNLNQLPKSSISLFDKAEKDSLFFSRQWFENLIATALNNDQKLLLACVVDGDTNDEGDDDESANDNEKRVLAILPLVTRDNKEWSSLCHLYSSLYSFFLADNCQQDNQQIHQQKILNCLCEGLKKLPFDYLTLEPIAEDDHNLNSLQLAMESSGFSCNRHFRFYNWFHRTECQTFVQYMADRPSRVRNTITRKQRKLEREHGYEIRLHTDGDIEQALADYHDIYKVSWKANEQYEDIVQGFTARATKSGWTRLAILYIEGKPVAAHLWFVVHRKASIFRLVYNQDWKHYSPGSILMSYLMEYVIDTDEVEEIDFLTGNDNYKKDWMTERRERWGLTCVKKSGPEERANRLTQTIKILQKWL